MPGQVVVCPEQGSQPARVDERRIAKVEDHGPVSIGGCLRCRVGQLTGGRDVELTRDHQHGCPVQDVVLDPEIRGAGVGHDERW